LRCEVTLPAVRKMVHDGNRKRQREVIFLMRQYKTLKEECDFEALEDKQLMMTIPSDHGMSCIINQDLIKHISDDKLNFMYVSYNGKSFAKIKGNLTRSTNMNIYRDVNVTLTGPEDEMKEV
jgi:hypothetical protein